MSAFYDLASLVVVPSGYKSGKIYAQKPLTTDGQLTFSRASTATRVNSAGLIETVSSNVPRLDYLGSTCQKLQLEPQRTNLQPASEDLSNGAAWSMGGASITANTAVSPDGTTNADKMVEDSSTARHELYSSSIAFSGTSSVSIFAKASGRRYFSAITGGDPSLGGATYDLQAGTIAATSGGTTASITPYGNGWYRCTFTTTRTNTSQVYFCLRTSGATPNVETYTGDGTSGILFWGGQVEVSSAYPSSYIKTTTAAVTRLADACSKTGISSLIGQTEGTLFADFVVNALNNASNILNSERNTNASFFLSLLTNGKIDAGLYASGSPAARITQGSVSVGQRAKVAYAYKSGSCALYINGTQVGTSSGTFTLPSTLDDLFLNDPTTYFAYQENVSFNQALLFKTRLTNAQLAELTTL